MINTNFKQRAKEIVSSMTLAEKIAQMKHEAPAIERLGIPEYNWWNECLHGVGRAGQATVFPQAIGMAASFDDELVEEIGVAISDEARAKYNQYKEFGKTLIYQGLTFWSPNINIFRDPRWGRGHETYGEDPYLTGKMGSGFVRGLQGYDKTHRKLDATIKHYAVHSGPEKGRHGFDSIVGKKDLYETYLDAFKYCIDNADPSAVMGAYNRVNGEPCCGSKTLLQDILFGEFGFDGYVVSDCGAICDINLFHKLTANEAESAALAVNNGCQMNCGSAYKWLKTAVAADLISEETITQAVERLFTARFKLGMFDECVYDSITYDVVECEKHTALNEKIAQKSMVLLKNDGILPLSKEYKKIAVIGPNAEDKSVLLGNYNGTPTLSYTLLNGVVAEAKKQDRTVRYAVGCHLFDETFKDWAEQPLHEAILAAKHSDVVIMCMGLNPTLEGEEGDAFNGDMGGDKRDLELPKTQRILYDEIKKTGTPIIYVNVTGSAMSLVDQEQNCKAIVQCFYPGALGGKVLADILFGNISPSGKLPLTFYKSVDDLPSFDDYSMKNRTYRYFEGTPLYPFGYGLTYGNVIVSDYKVIGEVSCGNDVELSIDVKNDSDVATEDVVQVYIKDENSEFAPCNHSLCGYKRVSLGANESKTIEIVVDKKALTVVNDDGKRVNGSGNVQFKVIV